MPQAQLSLAELIELEADLLELSHEVASVLCGPPDLARHNALQQLRSKIDQYRTRYTFGVQNLRSTISQSHDDTPVDAARRRQLAAKGPGCASLWDQIGNLITRQTLPSSFPPLITERSEIVRGASYGPVNYLNDVLFSLANSHAPNKSLNPDTHYRDIPLSGAYFINLLTAARRLLLARGHSAPVRFLDMGCGGGTKVLTASAMFDVAHGADFQPLYVEQAKQFFTKINADPELIMQADALAFDNYGDYDILYFYRPLKDLALATKMEKRVLDQVAPGTILIAPLNATLGRADTPAVKVIDRIYMAHTTLEEAIRLRDIAVNKGCETRITMEDNPENLRFWTPIVDQSRRNGFALF